LSRCDSRERIQTLALIRWPNGQRARPRRTVVLRITTRRSPVIGGVANDGDFARSARLDAEFIRLEEVWNAAHPNADALEGYQGLRAPERELESRVFSRFGLTAISITAMPHRLGVPNLA